MVARIARTLFIAALWGAGVAVPALLFFSGRRVVAFGLVLLLGLAVAGDWRWQGYARLVYGGLIAGLATGFFVGWLVGYVAPAEIGDQAAVVFVVAVPLGGALGLALAVALHAAHLVASDRSRMIAGSVVGAIVMAALSPLYRGGMYAGERIELDQFVALGLVPGLISGAALGALVGLLVARGSLRRPG